MPLARVFVAQLKICECGTKMPEPLVQQNQGIHLRGAAMLGQYSYVCQYSHVRIQIKTFASKAYTRSNYHSQKSN